MPPAPDDPTDAASRSGNAELALLEEVADFAFPNSSVVDIARLSGESRFVVGAVSTAEDERFVLKCAPNGIPESNLRREATVTNVVGQRTEVPVAEIVDAKFEPTEAPVPFVLFRWVDGRTLEESLAGPAGSLPAGVFGALGETMAALHLETPHDAPGRIVPTGPDAYDVAPERSWPEAFGRELADHVEHLVGSRFEPLAEELWTDISDRLRTLDTDDPPVLLHGDFGEGNVVYDGQTVSGVLDWEHAFVGHPEYDLCRAEVRYFWSQWGRRDAAASMLYAGYRSRRDLADGFDRRRPLYLATFYLMSLARFGDWAPRYTDDLNAFASAVADNVRGVLEMDDGPDTTIK
ncbi:MAG: phosphotransferase family protein [Halobacteriales archaeon]